MDDVERILNTTFPFVEQLLEKYGEFYLVATAVKTDNSIAQIGTYNGDDHPLSTDVLSELKTAIRVHKIDYRTVLIFYDVKVMDHHTNTKTDAVAVLVESANDDTGYLFFYPYQLRDKKLFFSKSWRELNDKEIFV